MFAPLVNPPMFVVTCAHNGEKAGCLVAFATQCSMEPHLFLACLSIENRTYKVANLASALGVHLLTDKDRSIASLFGEQTGDDVDKFTKISWRSGVTGAPILNDCQTFFEGEILEKVPFGDHVGFVLAPVTDVSNSGANEEIQLALHDVEDFSPGHPVHE
jgi:flavin reductase (DIM6/NTAB) family NADH-FMN oxidoreductase RutF